MTTIYCLLGSTPELSLAEIQALTGTEAVLLHPQIAQVTLPAGLTPEVFFERSGGIIKYFKPLQVLTGEASEPDSVKETLISELSQYGGKVTFGLAELGRDHLPLFDLAELKALLKQKDVTARYIDGPRTGLSASVLLHHRNVIEILLVSTDEGVIMAETRGVQDIDNWTRRDRSKPYADRKKGMLPPKVARMLLNIGLGQLGVSAATPDVDRASIRVYDPFCGTGTVLMEAAVQGCSVVGSDSDPDSVTGSQKNLAWLQHTYELQAAEEWVLGDVAHAQPRKPIDLIVTEPFLGKQTPRTEQLPSIFKGLEKMYLGAFKHWQSVLKPGAVVVMILPRVVTPKQTYRCQTLIDKLPDLRYTTLSGPTLYYRPQAVVEREVWTFKFLGK